MTRSWPEGNGTLAAPGSHGPSWRCADDTDTSTAGNQVNNCTTANLWGMNPGDPDPIPFNATPSDTSPLYGNGMTVLRFDVTADIRSFLGGAPNHGFIFKNTAGPLNGAWVNFASRHTPTPPRLILDVGPDLCPADPSKVQPGRCGCGVPETDTDGDGHPNCVEPTLVAVADTWLRLAIPNGNDGLGMTFGVTRANVTNLERSLIRFDQAEIIRAASGCTLTAAELELKVTAIASGWNGGTIEIRRMNRHWPEGVGLDSILGAHGPSWRCADDQDTTVAGNATNNCAASDLWGMTSSVPNPLPFVSTVTDTEPLFTATTTQARFNVTADVQAFLNGNPNYGWIVMGNTSASSGTSVNFGSRETEKAPVLRLTLTGSNCGDRDGDSLSDTDETNDGDGWTDPDVFNGMQARWKDHCHATPTCSAIDTVAEVNACTAPAPRETKTQAGGWNWQNPTSADICSPGYGFHPNWSVCDTDWQVDFQGFIELDNGGQHCFRVTSDTTGACGSAFFNNATTGFTSASGAQCFNVAAGVYPIRWFYETSGGPKTNFKVSYCHGGSQTCTPTVSVPSRMLRTQAPTCNAGNCGDGNVCNGVETCVSGSCVPGTLRRSTTRTRAPPTPATPSTASRTPRSPTARAVKTVIYARIRAPARPAAASAVTPSSAPRSTSATTPAPAIPQPASARTRTSRTAPRAATAMLAPLPTPARAAAARRAPPFRPTMAMRAPAMAAIRPAESRTRPSPQGTPCLDGNVCNGAEACNAIGFCAAGTPPTTDDGNPCTTDACHPTNGVTHTPVAAGTACLDGNVCNGAEACNATGTCQAGTPPNTNDGNPCTTDACDPVAGVSHTPVAAGTACPDGNACNGDELCNASAQCAAGTPIPTDDGNSCTNDECNPATGAVTHPPKPAGTVCTLDACTMASLCDGVGTCTGGAPIPIDDGIACTLDTCDPVTGPEHRPCAAIDPTVPTSVHKQLEWLYTGADPIQTGVAPGTIEPRRAAGLHGTVRDAAGFPLQNVIVTVNGRPEFGETITRADGAFDIVVNGGGTITLTLKKDGYLDVQRTEQVPWADGVQVDPVVMLKPDPTVTAVDLTSTTEPLQVARGSIIGDQDGIRQGTLLLPTGTEATMHMHDGTTAPLTEMNVRITEFTVGPNGPASMPAALPPTSHYTYAFEVNADEAVAAGARASRSRSHLSTTSKTSSAFPSASPCRLALTIAIRPNG